MTSRLDRLFSLLENCPNASLRTAAAEQLGELVQVLPSNMENLFTRLLPLLRSRNWVSRLAAADVIHSIVRHLPTWDPTTSAVTHEATSTCPEVDGFLSLAELRLDRILAQGARLYSMDARELGRLSSKTRTGDVVDFVSSIVSNEDDYPLPSALVQRNELNSRLGLDEKSLVTKVLATHSDVSITDWFVAEDFSDETATDQEPLPRQDVAACVQTAYRPDCLQINKRSSSPQSVRFGRLQHSAPKHAHIQHADETKLLHEESHSKPAASGAGLAWPLDSFCTTLLGDLWALRWETRHGAASGLRELLAESRHTKHCGKRDGMSEQEMYLSHSRYIEDIVVRVLCTLALDQLSDFISDEVVAPVRETAAQLLGVLSLHLAVEQVLLVSKHLVHLVTLGVAQGVDQVACGSRTLADVACKNSWMIAHGGLLGIKYLLASRKDLRGSLFPHVSSCLVAQLLMPAQTKFERSTSTQFPLDTAVHSGADEDIRAAAASALLPVVGEDCFSTLGTKQTLLLTDHVWSMLRDFTTDLSPSTGPLLRLASALTNAISEHLKNTCDEIPDKLVSEFWNDSKRFSTQVHTVARLLHHVSSGIRLQALSTLRCLFAAQFSQPRVSPEVLQLIVDQLFHRIILETCSNLRNRATNLCIDIVQSSDLPILAHACVERLDFWLCQAMQPVGVPFPRHLFTALISPHITVSQNFADNSPNPTIKTEYVAAVKEDEPVDIPSLNDETMMHCIAGSQFPNDAPCQTESYVWQTRICAVRVLTRLFARLCQYYPAQNSPRTVQSASVPLVFSELQPSILCYFLEHLLCRLHLTGRLAMQRAIAGLVLSCWAITPAVQDDSTMSNWAQMMSTCSDSSSDSELYSTELFRDLLVLSPMLRTKLESCLTEVVYYEEILGPFKLMQEHCRQLVFVFVNAGYSQDQIFNFNGVRTIAQCSALIEHASQLMTTHTLTQTAGGDSNHLDSSLKHWVDKSRTTVDCCLALQLHWGSLAEFAIAASLINLGWILPGRLSLLIRPLMDTIRCVPPTCSMIHASSSDSPSAVAHLLPTGCCLALQCLASICLSKLLILEWRTHCERALSSVRLQCDHDIELVLRNPSKAATKVMRNLASSLLESDSNLLTVSCDSVEPPNQPVNEGHFKSRAEPKEAYPSFLSDLSCFDSQYDSTWAVHQRRGVCLALSHICYAFIHTEIVSRESQSSVAKPLKLDPWQNLRCGLPGLWRLFWTDPLDRIWNILKLASTTCLHDDSCLRDYIRGDVFQAITQPIPKSDEDVICLGLSVLIVCTRMLPLLSTAVNSSITLDQLTYVGIICSCLPSTKLRTMGARLLSALAVKHPVPFYNLLIPLLLPCLELSVVNSNERLCSTCHAILDGLSVIVEHITSPSSGHQFIFINEYDPLADIETESGSAMSSDSDCIIEDTTQLPDPVRLFIPYIVLFVPSVLKLLADQDVHIRSSAGRLFALLLNLFPFENTLPDPVGMTRTLSVDRLKKRHFIDSLLHPENISVYNLPVPINARLRGYQQEGLNWLNFLNQYGLNGILCDDLGLGKTLQTICILAGSHHELKSAQNLTTLDTSTLNDVNCDSPAVTRPISLVVCPSTLCNHWLHEVNQFVNSDHLSPIIYVGGPAVRRSLQSQISQFDLVIASYDVVRNDIEFFQSIFWHYVVLDEGHIIKSSKSKVSRALKQLCAQHRLILTGTPIQNRVCELWSLFDFLMPDFLGTESEFAGKFARPVAASRDPKASKSEQRAGHKALENLHRLVLPFMLRRLKEDVVADLPPKIVQDFACELTSIQMQLYEAFTKSAEGQKLLTSIETENSHSSANRTASNSSNLHATYGASFGGKRYGFQALRYLQAVCNHPCLALKPTHPLFADMKHVVQSEFGPNVSLDSVHLSGKLLSLCRLLTDCGFGTPNFTAATPSTSVVSAGNSNEIIGDQSLMSQHRALIFFQTREMLQLTANVLRLHFPWLTYTRLDGSVPVNERHARVTRFNQDPSIDLMLLTTVVGGLGLNLTGADTVIFIEHDWNPCKDLQAMDRVHRIGQRRVVSVYRLITQDSIEEQIMNLQAFKLHLANTVITTDNRSLSDMDTEHLFDRLTTSVTPPTKRFVPNSINVDDLELCYEKEYNLDEFILKLNQCNR